ncbi:MAG TPA: class I SAM-dependent methyltransferase [Gaiellaceae bacterium]|nr:class I SAM-dependent methyltransferase [Gaiellaceae bacterium]
MKEAEIRPAEVHARYLALTREDTETFFAEHEGWADCPCPGCGADDAATAFTKHGFRYVECARCRSLFVSPRPPQSALDRFYRDAPSSRFWAREFFPAVEEARREKIIRPRVRRILDHPRLQRLGLDRPRVVDVGAGSGAFLTELLGAVPEAEAVAVEPGEDLAEQARARGLRVVEKPVELCDELAAEADIVTSFEVIEHVHDPEAFVRAVARLARPDGLILVTGLNGDGLDVQVLWSESNAVSPPHHLNFLSVHGLESLFRRAGLAEVEVETPGELDVELVRKGLAEGLAPDAPRFLRLLLERRDADVGDRFQRFLREAKLSSHTWIWATVANGSPV